MQGPDGLNPADPGIALLGRRALELDPTAAASTAGGGGEGALLVHCGEVPAVGGAATRLVLDLRELAGARHRCVAADASGPAGTLARRDFSVALLWPRAHLGMDFSEACIAAAARHVAPGGHVLLAARKQKGGKRLAATLQRLLGDLRVADRGGGYVCYGARRGETIDEALAAELLGKRYEIGDPLLGELALHSCPGVFSRRELDGGTRCLLEHLLRADVEGRLGSPARVVDLCCGIGPLALRAALDWPAARVLAIDSNFIAVDLARANAEAAGLGGRVSTLAHDGLPDPADVPEVPEVSELAAADLALVNPPTHADRDTLGRLLGGLRAWLAPGRRAMIVVNRPGRTIEALKAHGARGDLYEYPGFAVVEARWD